MSEKIQENQQQPKNDDTGKRLFFTILIALVWLCFVGLLLFTSSKCAKATYVSWTYNNQTYTSVVEYDNPLQTITSQHDRYNTNYTVNISVNGNNVNGNMVYSFTMNLVGHKTAFVGKAYTILSYGCTQHTTTSSNYLDLVCTGNVGVDTTTNTVVTIGQYNTNFMYRIQSDTYAPLGSSALNITGQLVIDGVRNTNLGGYVLYTYADGYSAGHTAGVTDGENNVTSDPNSYNLYTQAQYNAGASASYNDGYSAGESAVTTNPHDYSLYTSTEYNNYGTSQYNAGVSYADGRVNTSSASYSAGYTSGVTDGENNVTSSPNSYNLYTTTQYNDYGTQQYNAGYSAGQLDSSNFKLGQIDMLNYFSETYGDGTEYTSSSVLNPHGTLSVQVSTIYAPRVRDQARLSVLNETSQAYISLLGHYAHGSLTTYSEWDYTSYRNELELIAQSSAFIQCNDLLNALSGQVENGGTGTIYNIDNVSSWGQRYVYLNTEVLGWVAGMTDSTYQEGYNAGSSASLTNIQNNPSAYGYITISASESAVASARASGYSAGYTAGNQNEDNSLPKVITSIASVPLIVLTSMFNFDILGVNLFVFLTSILTLLIVIWVLKHVWK